MQHDYVKMRLFHFDMQHIKVDLHHNYIYQQAKRDVYVNTRLRMLKLTLIFHVYK